MNYEILFSFIGASMLLTIMPGPDIMYVLVQSISNGKKYGIVTALGLVTGILIHTTLVAFGVSAIISHSKSIFFIIKLFGSFYLLYLAFKAYNSNDVFVVTSKENKKRLFQMFKQGFIMNVLNPKVTIFFLAFFPGFLYSSTQNTIGQFYVLGGLFMLQAMVIFSFVAMLSGSLAMYFRTHAIFNNTVKWFQIVVLVSIAIFILIF